MSSKLTPQAMPPVGRVSPQGVTRQEPPDVRAADVGLRCANPTYGTDPGMVPKGWRLTTLVDVLEESGGFVQTGPFGSQLHASDYVEQGVPVVMPKDITNRVLADSIARVPESDTERLTRHRLRAGDIVFSRRGDVERHALIGILGSVPVMRPPDSALLAFEGVLSVTETRRSLNSSMAETLATLRDTLIPRLISGQLSLSDIAHETEACHAD